MIERIVNMSNARDKSNFLSEIGKLVGVKRFNIWDYRWRRSDRQNRYFHPAFCQALADYLSDQGDDTTMLEAKDIIKQYCLTTSKTDEKSGIKYNAVGHTSDLDTLEFNAFLDRCAAWLWNCFAIEVPAPSVYHEQVELENKK